MLEARRKPEPIPETIVLGMASDEEDLPTESKPPEPPPQGGFVYTPRATRTRAGSHAPRRAEPDAHHLSDGGKRQTRAHRIVLSRSIRRVRGGTLPVDTRGFSGE
jgi:hypothetical protein